MNRRKFLKLIGLLPVVGILSRPQNGPKEGVSNRPNTAEMSDSDGAPWHYDGQIDFREIDDSKLGEWWAALNDFELPMEFGEVPKSVNERDYLRGAFRIVNSICPRGAAMQAWQDRIAPRNMPLVMIRDSTARSTCSSIVNHSYSSQPHTLTIAISSISSGLEAE